MEDEGQKVAANVSRIQVWMPQPVHALATRPDNKVVAVGREDGDIELTVPTEGYRVEARIPGQKDKGLRSLAWIGGAGDDNMSGSEGEGGDSEAAAGDEGARLFGCGLDGTVFEVDLLRLCYKNVRDAYGGAAWCMRPAASLCLLAVGCEDGSIRLFSTEGGGVEYKRSFPSTGSRVLCLAWGPTNDVIFAGCLDSMIHCLDATTGQTLVSRWTLMGTLAPPAMRSRFVALASLPTAHMYAFASSFWWRRNTYDTDLLHRSFR